MAIKKTGLGKGLDSLIPRQNPGRQKDAAAVSHKKEETDKNVSFEEKKEKDEKKAEKQIEIRTVVKKEEIKLNINEVEPNRSQPRKKFDEDALLELADSIKQFGVLQPLLVQKKEDYYEIIAGERRWRAAKMAGLKEVPVVIKEFTDQQIVEIALIENIQREDLNPIEEALAYKRLLNEFHLKQDEVAERVCKSRTTVTNSMRLLKLDERIQQMIIDDMLTTGHARALLAVEDKNLQWKLAMQVFDEKLSVREVEKLVKSLSKEKKPKPEPENAFVYKEIAEKLKTVLGTKVMVSHKANNKGKIEIEYYSNEELERLLYLFQNIPEEKR